MKSLWQLSVVLNQPGTMLRFLFDDEARATEAQSACDVAMSSNAMNAIASVSDNYGCTAQVRGSLIVAVNLSNLDEEFRGEADKALAQALAQAEMVRRAKADSRLQAGAGLLTPNGAMPTFGRG